MQHIFIILSESYLIVENNKKNIVEIKEILFWAGVFITFIVVFILFIDPIKPFVYGLILAYIFIPLFEKMQRFGFSKVGALAVFVTIILSLLLFALLFFLPYLVEELKRFIFSLPSILNNAIEIIASIFDALNIERYNTADEIKALSAHIAGKNSAILSSVLKSVFFTQDSILSLITYVILCPIIAVYILYGYKSMVHNCLLIVPTYRREFITKLLLEINQKIYTFLGAQLLIAVIMMLFYIAVLSLVELNNAIIIALISGALIFIPYLGFILGLLLSLSFAIIQFWQEPYIILLIFVLFLIGQFVEANILTPKIMSKKLALPPLYILFLIVFFTSIWGVMGAIIAIPLGAVLDVILRHLLKYYQASDFYNKHFFLSTDKK